MEASSVGQNTMVDFKFSSCFCIERTSFMFGLTEYVGDKVLHSSYLIDPIFFLWRGKFIVVIKVYGGWVERRETFIEL